MQTSVKTEAHGGEVLAWAQAYLSEFRRVFGDYSSGQRAAGVFWLIGPFILLIERTPADIWLSVLALTFVVRSIVKRDKAWLKVIWVRLAFIFWFVCIFAGLVSEAPTYSVIEAIIWFRFPLFAMAATFWLASSRVMLIAMLISTAIGMLIMCGILVAETLIMERSWNIRLSWPYGDYVPGSYLAKACFPAFVVMAAMIMSKSKFLAGSATALVMGNLFVSILAGERVNFITRFCGAILSVLVWRVSMSRLFVFAFLLIALLGTVMIAMPHVAVEFTQNLFASIVGGMQSDYVRVLGAGYLVFEQSPWIGIGPGNYRDLAAGLLQETSQYRADNHPHNFYLQLMAETGLVGLFFGTLFLWSIVWCCFKVRLRNPCDVISATAFIIPFGLFWPITTTADFFGQWNNIFMWSGVALALAATNLVPEESDEPSRTTVA